MYTQRDGWTDGQRHNIKSRFRTGVQKKGGSPEQNPVERYSGFCSQYLSVSEHDLVCKLVFCNFQLAPCYT